MILKILSVFFFVTTLFLQPCLASDGVDFHLDRHLNVSSKNYTSPIIHFSQPMDRGVLSWNATTPDDSHIALYLRVRAPQEKWTPWFAMGIWGQHIQSHSIKLPETAFGKVDIDTLELKAPAQDWQYKIIRSPSKNGELPQVTNIALTVKNRQTYQKDFNPPIVIAKPLSVPAFSQYEAGNAAGKPDLGKRICSPTSDAMFLSFSGIQNITPLDVADRVYDSVGSEHYGNWPFNTAVLYSALHAHSPAQDVVSYVRWYESFNDVLTHVQNGEPVIVNIGFKEGELNGAFKPTPGHLVVVRGADKKYIYVNDPAAPTRNTVARRYDRNQFIKAWKGVAYIVEK